MGALINQQLGHVLPIHFGEPRMVQERLQFRRRLIELGIYAEQPHHVSPGPHPSPGWGVLRWHGSFDTATFSFCFAANASNSSDKSPKVATVS